MQLIKRFKFEILFAAATSFLYFFLRLTHIMSLPLFTDEAIYTRWSQIARNDAAWRFISLTDGKQPMYVWWDMVFMHFVHDPLLAGRLVSVLTGFITVVGLFLLGREIFKNKWVGLITAGLYVLYPFGLVYDRMALYDSMVAMFAVWSLYLEIRLVRTPKAWIAFTLALVLGGGMLTKTSDFFSWFLLPFTVVLFDFNKKERIKRLLTWIGFAILAVGLANVYYLVLRLSPFFHIINDKDAVFVYPISEWIHHPLRFFLGNLSGLWNWFIGYMSWPALVALVASLFVWKKYSREKLLLIIYFAAPFFALALFGKVLYPRFIFFMTVVLLPMVGLLIYVLFEKFSNKIWAVIITILLLLLWVRADYFIVTDFAVAPIPQADLVQYSNDWPAGGGVSQIISYLGQQAQTHKIYVASEGTFGSLPTYAVEIYLGENPNVEKGGIWPVPADIPVFLLKDAQVMPTYMIFNQTQLVPSGWPVKLIAKYQKGVGNSYISLYQVIPQKPL